MSHAYPALQLEAARELQENAAVTGLARSWSTRANGFPSGARLPPLTENPVLRSSHCVWSFQRSQAPCSLDGKKNLVGNEHNKDHIQGRDWTFAGGDPGSHIHSYRFRIQRPLPERSDDRNLRSCAKRCIGLSDSPVGICCFTYSGLSKSFTATPFQFPLFPADLSQLNRNLPPSKRKRQSEIQEDVFQLSPASVRFLLSVHFDLTKVCREGIGWLNYIQEQYVRNLFSLPAKQSDDALEPAASGAFSKLARRETANQIVTQILSSRGNGRDLDNQDLFRMLVDTHEAIRDFLEQDDSPIMLLPLQQKSHRGQVYGLVREMFPKEPEVECHYLPKDQMNPKNKYYNKLVEANVDIRAGDAGALEFKKLSKTESSRAKLLNQAKMARDMQDAIGFRQVIEMIIQYQRPVVGHNILLDLAHTTSQFLYPLPQGLEGFKSLVHRLFPLVFDTREIVRRFLSLEIPNANLKELYNRVKESDFDYTSVHLDTEFADVFAPPDTTEEDEKEEMSRRDEEYFSAVLDEQTGRPVVTIREPREKPERTRFHEAGYDAYVAGYVFARMIPFIGQKLGQLDVVPPPRGRNKVNARPGDANNLSSSAVDSGQRTGCAPHQDLAGPGEIGPDISDRVSRKRITGVVVADVSWSQSAKRPCQRHGGETDSPTQARPQPQSHGDHGESTSPNPQGGNLGRHLPATVEWRGTSRNPESSQSSECGRGGLEGPQPLDSEDGKLAIDRFFLDFWGGDNRLIGETSNKIGWFQGFENCRSR